MAKNEVSKVEIYELEMLKNKMFEDDISLMNFVWGNIMSMTS